MPPRPGDIIELAIDTLAYGGQGVAHDDGFVVFVRGVVPGDRVRAEVTRRKAQFAEARLLEVVEPSERRVEAPCAAHGDCGGCEWQAMAYETQLEFKQRQVVESLEHIGGLSGFAVEPIRGMDDPWRYRNKMEYSFGLRDGELVLGLHRRGSWREIVEGDGCRLAPEETERARQAVATACRALSLPAYSQETHHGLLRHLVVRRGLASGELLLDLFVTSRFREEQELAARVAAAQPFTSFAVTVNESRADAATGVGPFMVSGPPHFHETLGGLSLRVPALAFLQTNSTMCDVLYETTLAWAAPEPDRPAYDLYCGIGGISLLLARSAAVVYGMEAQPEAIEAARVNAGLNGVGNVVFSAGDVRALLLEPPTGVDPELATALEKDPRRIAARPFSPPSVVVADPPRAGMSKKAVERMALLGADRVVYVSCNPTTLAANAAQLDGLGYRLRRIAPVDMFPHTHHIETVALFTRG